jgi:hypothetical protein
LIICTYAPNRESAQKAKHENNRHHQSTIAIHLAVAAEQRGMNIGHHWQPKTNNSYREVGACGGTLKRHRSLPGHRAGFQRHAWLFANEKGTQLVWMDNLWRRHRSLQRWGGDGGFSCDAQNALHLDE